MSITIDQARTIITALIDAKIDHWELTAAIKVLDWVTLLVDQVPAAADPRINPRIEELAQRVSDEDSPGQEDRYFDEDQEANGGLSEPAVQKTGSNVSQTFQPKPATKVAESNRAEKPRESQGEKPSGAGESGDPTTPPEKLMDRLRSAYGGRGSGSLEERIQRVFEALQVGERFLIGNIWAKNPDAKNLALQIAHLRDDLELDRGRPGRAGSIKRIAPAPSTPPEPVAPPTPRKAAAAPAGPVTSNGAPPAKPAKPGWKPENERDRRIFDRLLDRLPNRLDRVHVRDLFPDVDDARRACTLIDNDPDRRIQRVGVIAERSRIIE